MRTVAEHSGGHDSQWTAIVSIAAKIGCKAETLPPSGCASTSATAASARGADDGAGQQRIKTLERKVRELRQANEILRKASVLFRLSPLEPARPPLSAVKAFIDEHRGAYGVEPICRVMLNRPVGLLGSTRNAQGSRRCTACRRSATMCWRPRAKAEAEAAYYRRFTEPAMTG